MYDIAHLDLPPLAAACGRVQLPGSKSISNRVLLLAALSEGCTEVHDLLDSDDTRVMLDALRSLGCVITPDYPRPGQPLRLTGIGAKLGAGKTGTGNEAAPLEIFLGNAGTAMRPLTAALALLGGHFYLHGVPRMHERPIGDLVDALCQLGCQVQYAHTEGYPPLRIAPPAPGTLDVTQPVRVRGDVSSQFLTALLLALPLLSAHGPITVQVQGDLISRPYIHITLELLSRFGIAVRNDHWQQFTITAHSRYQSPGQVHVEADASSASYFVALGTIAAHGVGQGIEIHGVGAQSIQGDIRFIDAARQMGADIESGSNWLRVRRGRWPLEAIDLDCNHIPDAAMTLAVMALYANGPSTLRNIASWRVKETDRIAAMTAELRKLGATVEEGTDYIRITPPATPAHWRSASIATYDDHRMAMCFSLAAFNPAGLSVRIEDPRCVGKTFPEYFETFFSLVQPCEPAPVLCIDGPTASGKGTVAARVAQALGFHLLDSGALYRIAALLAVRNGLPTGEQDLTDAPVRERVAQQIAQLVQAQPVVFTADGRILLGDEDIAQAIRAEAIGLCASRISALPAVRAALLESQRQCRRLPGLVADGRDMGTAIFPDARLKVFLHADVSVRAQRRCRQLLEKGQAANIEEILSDLQARDARDIQRSASPLKPAEDARHLDNTHGTVDEAVAQVLHWWQQVG